MFRGRSKSHSGITEKPTRDCISLYNNAGLGVGNFDGKVWTSKISITPLSLGASCLGNPCEIANIHTNLMLLETRIIDLLCRWQFVSIFVQIFLVGAATFRKTSISKKGRFGRSRSSKVTDTGANRKRIVDFLLVRNSNFGPILHRFRDMTAFMCSWPHPYSTLILGVFPLHQIAHVGRQRAHGP